MEVLPENPLDDLRGYIEATAKNLAELEDADFRQSLFGSCELSVLFAAALRHARDRARDPDRGLFPGQPSLDAGSALRLVSEMTGGEFLAEQLRDMRETLDGRRGETPRDCALTAARMMGMEVLREKAVDRFQRSATVNWVGPDDPPDLSEEARLRSDIRGRVLGVLSAAYDDAERARSLETRRGARAFLSEFFRLLTPGGQGLQDGAVTKPEEVVVEYHRTWFRLEVAFAVFRSKRALNAVTLRERRVEAAEAARLPLEVVDRHLSPDADGIPHPLSTQEAARIHVANLFGITQHRLSNILSET